MYSSIIPTTSWSLSPKPNFSWKNAPHSGMLIGASAATSSAVSVPPARSASSFCSPCHTPIESSNVPSQSNTTPISLASMTHPSLAFSFSQA